MASTAITGTNVFHLVGQIVSGVRDSDSFQIISCFMAHGSVMVSGTG